jgi:hypothetical protein
MVYGDDLRQPVKRCGLHGWHCLSQPLLIREGTSNNDDKRNWSQVGREAHVVNVETRPRKGRCEGSQKMDLTRNVLVASCLRHTHLLAVR